MSSEDKPWPTVGQAVQPTGPLPPIHITSEPDPHLVSLQGGASFAADQYETLRHVVERAGEATGLRVVAITSPAPGDGKTLTAINLAAALARSPRAQVLIIDGDLRRPAVLDRLGMAAGGEKGLAQAATSPSVSLRDVIRYSPKFNLFILPAGRPSQAPYDVLRSPLLGPFFDLLRRHFHYIVLDSPPAIGFPDFRVLEKWADGSLLVVAAGVTPRKMVELTLDVVDPEKTLGIVFNRADLAGIARHYGRYYRQETFSPR